MTRLENEILDASIQKLNKILDKNRIRILYQLNQKETCTCELVEELNIANNLMSHHLKVLSELDLIEGRNEGLHRKYFIKDDRKKYIGKLLTCLPIYSEIN